MDLHSAHGAPTGLVAGDNLRSRALEPEKDLSPLGSANIIAMSSVATPVSYTHLRAHETSAHL
eukprot:12345159-Alexandrium_andersonii.AAC.1